MKKFNLLMALMMVFALSFAACNDDEEQIPPTDGGNLTFEVTVGEITSSSIAYTVTPSDLKAEYLCILADAKTVESFTRDEFLVEAILEELKAEAGAQGKTLAEYMPEIVDKGAITNGKFSNLSPASKYYIILFGVDPANGYKANSDVVKKDVTTEEFQDLNITFEVETTVDGNSATFKIIPSNNDDVWYFTTLPKATYDTYTDPAGQYKMETRQFMLFCLQQEIEARRQQGMSDTEIMNAIFHKGALELEGKGLTANTEYINQIAGFIITPEGQVTIATDVTTTTYTTGNAQAQDFTFEITVGEVEAMNAAIKIVPTDETATFCWMVAPWDGKKTATEVMNDIVAQYGNFMNNGAMLYKGVQDYTGGPGSPYKYKLDAADTYYYVIAFGYAGGVTTEPVMETFRSLAAPDPESTTFQITASDISPYGFSAEVTPSETTTYYTVKFMPTEEFKTLDFDQLTADINANFDEMFAMSQMFDPNTTVAQVLSTYYYKGVFTVDASELTPETACSGFVAALSAETGHVVKIHKFENIATTGKLGNINPSIELIGYWSGDDEAGQIFGQPDATRGKAITVVKYSGFNSARKLFALMWYDEMTNVDQYPDASLWSQLKANWLEIDQSQPYSFYVVEWETPQTAFAYAEDNDGNPGTFGRLFTRATAENKGNIQDLIDLVEKLNATSKSSFTLPKSGIIGKNTGITRNDKNIKANTPVANVVKNEVEVVEPKPFASSYNVSYVRPFYL